MDAGNAFPILAGLVLAVAVVTTLWKRLHRPAPDAWLHIDVDKAARTTRYYPRDRSETR